MTTKVNLQDLIDEMDMQFDSSVTLVNLKTGELVPVLAEFLSAAEDNEAYDHLPDWQQDEMKTAIDILEHEDNYARIPSKFEIHDYSIMEKFCYGVEDPKKANALLNAIRGRGAFRRFKDKIAEIGLENQWFDYHDACYREISIDFCKRHNLDYE